MGRLFYWGEANNPNRQPAVQRNQSGSFFYWGERNRPTGNRAATSRQSLSDAPTSAYFDHVGDYQHLDRWTWAEWYQQPMREVPLKGLTATQKKVLGKHLNKHMWGNGQPDDGDPLVLQQSGRNYLMNGHHRAAVARLRGERTIRARVMRSSR